MTFFIPRFSPGQVVATPGAMALELDLLALLSRHVRGDWGDLDDADKAENELSVEKGFRILSAYETDGGKVWIITEWDRSVTTILLPSEY